MELINPICDAGVKPHIGKHVCVVLVDGTTIYGTLGGLNGQQLMLRSCLETGEALSTNGVKAKAQLEKRGKKVKVSGFGYPGYGHHRELGLDLALIALLFAIPFLWI
ncbi:MAG: hypothetical protein K0R57_1618 [Paenibacillaceae bacterium]|nr:hypothetical protein [Paenibacillaceae bacterium]